MSETNENTSVTQRRLYLAVYDSYWGVGSDILAARAQARSAGCRGGRYTIYLMPDGATDVYLDAFGRMCWTCESEDEPVELLSDYEKKRR